MTVNSATIIHTRWRIVALKNKVRRHPAACCVLCGKVFDGLDDVCSDCARAVSVSEKGAIDNVCAKCGKPHDMDGSYCEDRAGKFQTISPKNNKTGVFVPVLVFIIGFAALLVVGSIYNANQEKVTASKVISSTP